MSLALMAPLMFAALVFFLLLGYPAAFSLGAVGLIFALIGIELGQFAPDFLQALPERIYGVMSNDTLLAIPFFTFMGLVLERSGMAEDLLDTIGSTRELNEDTTTRLHSVLADFLVSFKVSLHPDA